MAGAQAVKMVPVSSPTGSRPKAESSRERCLSVATLAASMGFCALDFLFTRGFFAAMLLTSLVDDRVDPPDWQSFCAHARV